jgi:acyl transferase domain-containing protein/NAD(P)-dependent dehydrogenase (short-subunit alcohol dehydrogenase family)/NAD(P)H-dependent flavin oxidoreductase YrpB (nitropropane dioxygenase family)
LQSFICASLSPIDLEHAGLAVATMRAHGTAILDAELLIREDRAQENLAQAMGAEGSFGIRITPAQLALAERLGEREHLVIITGWSADALPELLQRLASPRRNIWLEIGNGEELASMPDELSFHGFVGRGAECGGRCGHESAYILAQHLTRQQRPFLVQGSIGPGSAAACRVAGAAGVILDDALLLLRESPLRDAWKEKLARVTAEDTARIDGVWRFVSRPDFAGGRELLRRGDANAVRELLRWDDPDTAAWPIGEGIGRAAAVAQIYGSVGRFVRAVRDESERFAALAAERKPLAENAPLARIHATRFPIVQGPMTRVSDGVDFASAVADGGALPLLALALMRAPAVEALLEQTQSALGDRPWGIGILGFVPQELRDEQIAVVERIRPRFALIAGGRPDQAARLERLGISTYLHAPNQLLRFFLEQGARRFVFEGAECGGHVGPLHSFTLWQSAIDVIHDALSAAMVAALAAPLLARGVRIGVLMGTAYLFTDEAVHTSAITGRFRDEALACRRSITIETRPGHAVRCAPTPFIDAFERERLELRSSGLPHDTVADALEAVVAGRLRIASKGIERRGDELCEVGEETQRTEGLYMLGDVATLRESRTTIAALHEEVTAGATALLDARAKRRVRAPQTKITPPIAIVGVSCILPGAHDPDTYWRNLLDLRSPIREIPLTRWDWRLFYDADPAARDKIISRWGGFIDPLSFDPLRFGIPPKSLPSIALPQLLALEVTRRALHDAGYGDSIDDELLRERTAVIFGTGNTADVEQFYTARSALPLLFGDAAKAAMSRMPEWSEESYPGILVNVVAGRVANRFDLGGPNTTLDAACASSFAALDLAVRELDEHRSDLVIAGGIECEQTPHAYMAFSSTRALSPRGKASVFDTAADGIVISEGAIVLVLKRLADAERDGDRIHALIRSVAGSSDGKGLGLTAPLPRGQRRAISRAHDRAGIAATDLQYYEAHATGTAVGDAAELETIDGVLRDAGAAPRSCAIGSAKSVIGHTRAAAGMAGLLKAALALRHRVLPPHAGIETPMQALRADDAPMYVNDKPRPWLAPDAGPRRAGVSAFGFGGTNYHVVLEEYRGARSAPGAAIWPAELFILGAADGHALDAQLERLVRAADNGNRLADLAHACARVVPADAKERVAFVAATHEELREQIRTHRRTGGSRNDAPGELAFLFPGQGSQSVGMGSELALYFEEMRDALALGGIAGVMFPPAAFTDHERIAQESALTETAVAQPAIGAISCGMLDLARRCGLRAARAAGHSYGELVALHAAGVVDRESMFRISRRRGTLMSEAEGGAMAAAMLAPEAMAPYLARFTSVVIANVNAPEQVVLSGPADAIDAVATALREDGHGAQRLAVSAAFHSPLMRPASEPFAQFLRSIDFAAPAIPVHANRDGAPYPHEPDAIRQRCSAQLEQRVDFVAQIESMYAAGVRTFLELGPGRVLTSLVRRILGDRPHRAIAADGGVRAWLDALAQLWLAGHDVDVAALHRHRDTQPFDLDRPIPDAQESGWLLDGGRIWQRDASPAGLGELPFLTSETAASAELIRVHPRDSAEPADPVLSAYREYEETMRRFLDQQERILMHVLERGGDSSALHPALPAPEMRVPELPAAETLRDEDRVDHDSLIERLVAVVSERTGYPASMLDPHRDLEAELGIDSIKRVEILSVLQKSLPPHATRAVQGQLDHLTRVKTLHHLVEAVIRGMERLAPVATTIPSHADCPRYVMKSVLRALPRAHQDSLEGLYVVTEDAGGLAGRVVEELRKQGAQAYLVERASLETFELLERRISVLRYVHGSVHGIVHLAGFGEEAHDLASWRRATWFTAKSLFHLLQTSADDLEGDANRVKIVVASRMGGHWGRGGQGITSPAAAASHGIIRTLEKEYPAVRGTMVDFDAPLPDNEAARRIVEEVLAGTDDECGYAHGERRAFRVAPAPLDREQAPQSWEPEAGSVVLITGGASGITLELSRRLARAGVHLVIAGRSPESSRVDALDSLRARGAEIEYHELDVRNEQTFGALIDGLYDRFGHIDAVVHGAGVIEDCAFIAKESDSFDRVFDTKADSTFILSRRLRPAALRWVALFGSISGRFGNRAQADYAAANAAMTALALEMDARWPSTRVVSFQWGPWAGSGMASEGVLALLRARGIEPIDPADGLRFFADEMSFGRKGEVEVIAGEGPWKADSHEQLRRAIEVGMIVLQVGALSHGGAPM